MRGFSTMELLLAMAVFSLGITAAAIVVFGTQSAASEMRQNREALSIASRQLEEARMTAKQNFGSLSSVATTTESGYERSLVVADFGPYRKLATSQVSWDAAGQMLQTSLTTLLTDWRNVGSTYRCPLPPAGNWGAPQPPTVYSFSNLIPSGAYGWGLSDSMLHDSLLYISAYTTPIIDKDTLFIFDVSNPNVAPRFLGALATAPTYAKGLQAIAVAPVQEKIYIFAASASSFAKGQLMVIDATNPNLPFLVATYKIPISVAAKGGFGRSIFYRAPYLYLGLTSISTGGDEFNIIDVSSPLTPQWVGGYSVGHDVNAIFVKGNYAYLAHPSDSTDAIQEELTVLDVSNPPSITRFGGFHFATGIGGHGEAIDVTGTTLYFGRTASNISGASDGIPEWYLLDNTNPGSYGTPLNFEALSTGDSVNGLYARGSLAYLLTNYELQILGISDTNNSIVLSSTPLTSPGLAFDCDSHRMYIAQAQMITTITPGQ